MKKIRSGNDAKICWTITKNVAVGDAIDLHDAEVLLIDALKHPATFAYTINTINDYTVQVVGTFYGKDQCTKGKYNLLLVKNRGQVDMITLDYIDAFILTGPSKFGVVSGNDEGSIKTICVRLDSEYEAYVGGPDMQNYYTKDEIDAMFETNQADWTEDDTTSPSYIKNKPEVYTQSEVNTLLAGKQDTLTRYREDNGTHQVEINGTQANIYITQDKASIDFGSSNSYVDVNAHGVDIKTPANGHAYLNGYTLVTTPVLETSLAGKQDTLTFDQTPSSGSNNPVTSNGIYNAIHSWPDKNNIIIWNIGSEATPDFSQHRWIEITTALEDNDRKYFVFEATNAEDNDNTVYYHMKGIYTNSLSGDIVSVNFERLEKDTFKGLSISEGTNGTISYLANGNGTMINSENYGNYTYSKTVLDGFFNEKQDELVSSQNIKTINNVSILGSGNLSVAAEQVQADWNESDTTSKAYILNKPSVYTQSEINTYLGDKQDTLVSGTNIKTVNSYSLLGSGNIEIGGTSVTFDNEPTENSYNAAYSGGIYKVITDDELVVANSLIDLRNNIGTKQDALVSGTNIKTINSESLLGSGNISISFTQTKANWNESNSSSNAYIQNKPIVVTSSTSGVKIEVVTALPASPDSNTIYIVNEA